jgi:hypothetical protein
MGRILLVCASVGFQIFEFLRDMMVQLLDNDASPFTVYALKLGGAGFASQCNGSYRSIITAQVSDFYVMVCTSHYHGTGLGLLYDE